MFHKKNKDSVFSLSFLSQGHSNMMRYGCQYPRADCYLAASIISAARALLSKDATDVDMPAIKRVANTIWLIVVASE